MSIKELARYAGVGTGTVSRVLNGDKNVSEKTRENVLKAIEDLHYTPNSMAKKLRKNANGTIALLVPVINHPFFANFAYYVEDEADKYGYTVILVSSQSRIEKEKEIFEKIRRRDVDGAIFVTHYEHNMEDFINYPIATIDRPVAEGVPFVTSDNYEASFNAVEFLIEKGCKKIGYLGSKPSVNSEVIRREDAYKDVMRKYGYEERILDKVIKHGEELETVREFLDKFDDMDGIFVSGYSMGQMLDRVLHEKNKKIPEEIQIVSYDGNFGAWGGYNMTCVEQPVEEMAREIFRIVLNRINGKEVPMRTEFKTKLVMGNTTKK